MNINTFYFVQVLVNEGLAENAEKMGKLFRDELTSRLNRDIATIIRGKGLLNAVVIPTREGEKFYVYSSKNKIYKQLTSTK